MGIWDKEYIKKHKKEIRIVAILYLVYFILIIGILWAIKAPVGNPLQHGF